MDLISKAIKDVQYAIPREILKMAYLKNTYLNGVSEYNRRMITLDEAIREMTIVPRVIVDSNCVGGQTVIISLEGLSAINVDAHNYIYQIPEDRLNNRTIMSVLEVNFFRAELMPGYTYGALPSIMPNPGNELSTVANKAMDSRSSIPILSTSECSVVGHNTILVRNHLRSALPVQCRCIVENDENLKNLSVRSAPDFVKLCTYAVKSFIYNELIVKLDRGAIDRGHEIGAIKSIIESYADAEENYWTFLKEEWQAIMIHSDRHLHENLMKIQMDPCA